MKMKKNERASIKQWFSDWEDHEKLSERLRKGIENFEENPEEGIEAAIEFLNKYGQSRGYR